MDNEKIEIITLGCSKNTVDSERLSVQLTANNLDVVKNNSAADTIIIRCSKRGIY